MFLVTPLMLLGLSLVLSMGGSDPTHRTMTDRRFLQSPWSELWRVLIMLPPTILVEFYLLVLAAFVGRNYWGIYVVVWVGWLAAFGPLCLPNSVLGRATRRLAIGILSLGTVLWLACWVSELHNPGWQF